MNRLHHPEQFSASAGASTAVGSSSSRIRRVGGQRLHDLEPLLEPDAEPAGGRVGIERETDTLAPDPALARRKAAGCTGHPAASATFSATLSAGTEVKCW